MSRPPLSPKLDPEGPYVILSTQAAAQDYAGALQVARGLHPGATEATFLPEDLSAAKAVLDEKRPRYALVLIHPEELDVNFAWRWLTLTAGLDEDPFVDVRTGFVTGATPAAAADFLRRTQDAVAGRISLPPSAVDNLGPNTVVPESSFQETAGSFMIPVLGGRFDLRTISHGTRGVTEQRLGQMGGAGLVHFGGHGYPDRIVDCLNGPHARKLPLSPCVVFNGACYTGVTGRWYEAGATVQERFVRPEHSFCLNLLQNRAVAYLAALHPDHGIPVYQEMEFLATDGASLGDVIKRTHDGVILGAGGKLPEFETFADGAPAPAWSPSEFMLKGTASRVLFGDPALILCEPFADAPFEVSSRGPDRGVLDVTATLRNTLLKATYTDTYHADLAADPNQFNDRALVRVSLPEHFGGVGELRVLRAAAGGSPSRSRLVGFGVEEDGASRTLHVQVDLPARGYMDSEFRRAGSAVSVRVTSRG